jgi:hypothetical protein
LSTSTKTVTRWSLLLKVLAPVSWTTGTTSGTGTGRGTGMPGTPTTETGPSTLPVTR